MFIDNDQKLWMTGAPTRREIRQARSDLREGPPFYDSELWITMVIFFLVFPGGIVWLILLGPTIAYGD